MTEIVHCNSCGKDAYPSLNLNDRMVLAPCCPDCGAEHVSLSANDMTQTPVVEVKSISADEHRVEKVVSQMPHRGVVDPVQAIKIRLEFLEAEMAKMDDYRKERTRLRRMLRAAGDST